MAQIHREDTAWQTKPSYWQEPPRLSRLTLPRTQSPSIKSRALISNNIHQTLAGLGVEDPDLTPAVPIKRSVRKASIV